MVCEDHGHIETVICPHCGDVLMSDYLSSHIFYVHLGPKRINTPKRKSNPKKEKAKEGYLLDRPAPSPTKKQKRAALKQTEKSKIRRNGFRIVVPSGTGSSMFGGVKYSNVKIFPGGLPGLGKR